MNIFEKIESGVYFSPYQDAPPPSLLLDRVRAKEVLEATEKALATWKKNAHATRQRQIREREDAFRKDLEAEYEMTNHPKADALYTRAYDDGHSSGYTEIANCYAALVELVK